MSRSEIIRRTVVAVALASSASVPAVVTTVEASKPGVQLEVKEADRRVDVFVDGKPFTSSTSGRRR